MALVSYENRRTCRYKAAIGGGFCKVTVSMISLCFVDTARHSLRSSRLFRVWAAKPKSPYCATHRCADRSGMPATRATDCRTDSAQGDAGARRHGPQRQSPGLFRESRKFIHAPWV